jgi:hypothetical protein
LIDALSSLPTTDPLYKPLAVADVQDGGLGRVARMELKQNQAAPHRGGMEKPEYFELAESYARFRPEGSVSLEIAVALVGGAIAFCHDQKIPRLLADTTRLTGFLPPTIADRYFIAQDWAEKAKGKVIVALVVPPEVPDPQKFEVTAATNAGQRADVFTSESEALDWLLRQE